MTLIQNTFLLKDSVNLSPEYQAHMLSGSPIGRKLVGDSKFSPRPVGVEIEYEKWNGIAGKYYWTAKKDGSLKDDGVEYISPPIGGLNIEAALLELAEIYKNNITSVFSHRCSIHVHVNVRDLTQEQLRALIAAYICMENLFFREVAEFRRNSVYCSFLTDLAPTSDQLFNKADHGNIKYFALNYGTMSRFGTVEFRHHQGTKDIKELAKWIKLCQSFVDFFKNCKPEEVFECIKLLNTISEYHLFIEMVFGYNPWPMVDLHKEMSRNVSIAKRMIR